MRGEHLELQQVSPFLTVSVLTRLGVIVLLPAAEFKLDFSKFADASPVLRLHIWLLSASLLTSYLHSAGSKEVNTRLGFCHSMQIQSCGHICFYAAWLQVSCQQATQGCFHYLYAWHCKSELMSDKQKTIRVYSAGRSCLCHRSTFWYKTICQLT